MYFSAIGPIITPSKRKQEQEMNKTIATKAGVHAYRDGRGRAPAMNKSFLVAASASGELVKMMDAYMHGWTIAMLADGIADQNMPSVVELAKIEAA